jgi:hypothetical protein
MAHPLEAHPRSAPLVFVLRVRRQRHGLIRTALVSLLFAILPVPAHGLTPGQVFTKVKDAVVVVTTWDTKGRPHIQGSGVLISPGKVATNCHVLKGTTSYEVSRREQVVAATLYGKDSKKDICVLDIKDFSGKPAQLGNTDTLKVGDPVYAVGAPEGLELSLSSGIVAALRGGQPPWIQNTAAMDAGSSGGGLFDGAGRLVGLTTYYLKNGQKLSFALPVEWIDAVTLSRKPTTESRKHAEWVQRAAALEERNDWQGLRDYSQKWTKNEPDNAPAWFNLATAYHHLYYYDEAIVAYRQALRIDPEDAAAWFNIGKVYATLHREKDAITAYHQGLLIDPTDADTWYNIGIAYDNSGNRAAARNAVRELRRLDPGEARKLSKVIGSR